VLAIAAEAPTGADLRLKYGENLLTGVTAFSREFGKQTSLEEDLLNVAAAIYAVDLAFKRPYGDLCVRTIDLSIEVTNRAIFQAARGELQYALYLLSNDNWRLRFTRGAGTPERGNSWPSGKGATLLFSGGLDSFCAAAERVERRQPLWLVSHVTGNPIVRGAQEALFARLIEATPSLNRLAFRVGGRVRGEYIFPADHDREDTQRTRSFLFLSLAALVGRRTGHDNVITMAENGQLAINAPLTSARVGPFSTHTAHPEFVAVAQELLRNILSHPLTLENPYLYLTKAEVLDRLPAAFRTDIGKTVSCWRASRVRQFRHCGDCVPCIVRRIALENRGVDIAEYARDLFRQNLAALDPLDPGKRNIAEMILFVQQFESARRRGPEAIRESFPEIINPYIDFTNAVAMYSRFCDEALQVFRRYRYVAELL